MRNPNALAAVTLCALHFISCSVGLTVMKMLGVTQSSGKTIPWTGTDTTTSLQGLIYAVTHLQLLVSCRSYCFRRRCQRVHCHSQSVSDDQLCRILPNRKAVDHSIHSCRAIGLAKGIADLAAGWVHRSGAGGSCNCVRSPGWHGAGDLLVLGSAELRPPRARLFNALPTLPPLDAGLSVM